MGNTLSNFLDSLHDFGVLIKFIVLAICILCELIFGIPDLLRFSIKRIWAISGVCFDESIRRKVLWIIPLAILGLVIVVLFQQPFDEQDAIRETTKFCLFATGMVVVISTVILACTNLPREIENRVIFTVVTKPTTRLEIVLGKIVGFARVSAVILLIMGVFSFGFLHLIAWNLQRDLRDRLAVGAVESISRPRFQHYVDAGLLNSKTIALPREMNIYATKPNFGSNRRYPTKDGMILVPFRLPQNMVASADPDGKQYTGPGMIIQVRAGFDPVPPTALPGKPLPAPSPPKISLAIFDQNVNSVFSAEIKDSPQIIPTADGSKAVQFTLGTNFTALLTKYPWIYMQISCSGDGNLWMENDPKNPAVQLIVPVTSQPNPIIVLPSNPTDPSQEGAPVFAGREGVTGQQVKGDPTGNAQVCVYHFQNLKIEHASSADRVPLEFRVGIEKSGEVGEEDVPTKATFTVLNLTTGKESDSTTLLPENNHPFYSSVPASFVEGGNFDLILHCASPDQWLNLKHDSISVVQAENSFAWNLFKSAFILWLLSILVTTISVFCSTFLSWPIAVVLTLVILLGRWGVNQLGDAATAGIGRTFTQDMGVKDPAAMQVLSTSVEDLNRALKMVSAVLPDIEAFAATDNIDKGISIPSQTIRDSGLVLSGFGVPLTLLAYIFLKNKEVAP